jgi:protein import protein ZIM17
VKGATLGDSDRYIMMFKCGACGHADTKTFTKKAYHETVVIMTCDNCGKNHLIADNLGWFRDKPVNVEDLAKESGNTAVRINNAPKLSKLLETLKFVGDKETVTLRQDKERKEILDSKKEEEKKQ